MQISKTGGLIAAASKRATHPNLKLGAISVVQQIVLTFQQAGIFPIVVVTGFEADEVKYSLSGRGVVFLYNESYQDPELFESVCIGLNFLKDKCERVVFTPVNVPLFSPDTLRSLLSEKGDIISPSFNRKGGHPVVLSNRILPRILSYDGNDGLRGALNGMRDKRRWVNVPDEGVLLNVHKPEALKAHLNQNKKAFIHSSLHFGIACEEELFDARAKLLLLLIGETHSVRAAGEMMAMSLSKAWNILNKLEISLGYAVITRRKGGRRGSGSDLTPEGLRFLVAFQQYEEQVQAYSDRLFQKLLAESRALNPGIKTIP